jgi:large conductance mechanosensitive channel
VSLKPAVDAAHPAVTWNYGKFIQSIVDFVIIAFAIFMLIKAMNSMKKKEEAKAPEVQQAPQQEVLLTEIRDLLKQR